MLPKHYESRMLDQKGPLSSTESYSFIQLNIFYIQCIFFKYASLPNLYFLSLQCLKNWCIKDALYWPQAMQGSIAYHSCDKCNYYVTHFSCFYTIKKRQLNVTWSKSRSCSGIFLIFLVMTGFNKRFLDHE